MPQIGNLGDIGSKWSRRAGNAGQEFEQGVEASSDQEWESATANAQDAWNQGVQDAANNGRFASGVQDSTKSWQQRTLQLGPRRFTEGVQASEGEYEAGFAPYRDVIEGTNLPPRGARGDAGNYQRSQEMGEALHQARLNR